MEPPDERIVEQYLETEQEQNDNAFLGTVADLQRALDAEREKVKGLQAHQLIHDRIFARQKALIGKYLETIREAARRLRNSTHSAEQPEPMESRTPIVAAYLENVLPLKPHECEAELATLQAQLRQVEGQSKQQAEEAVIVFAKYTALQAQLEQVERELANEKTAYKKLSEQWNKDNVDLSTFREVENDMKDE